MPSLTALSQSRVRGRIARLRGPGLLTLTAFISAGVSFLVNILTARVLGPDGRGAVALVLQLAYICAPLAVFGFPRAKLRLGNESDTLVGGGRTWLLLCLALVSPVVVLLYGWWYILFLPAAAVSASFQVLRSRAIVEGTYSRYFLAFLGYQGSILAVTLLLAMLSLQHWQWWSAAYFIPSIAVLAVSHGSYEKALNPVRWIRANWAFAWAGFSHILIMRADRLALGYFAGSGPLGLYVVVATAIEPVYWVVQSISDSRTAGVYRNARPRALLGQLLREASIFAILGAVAAVALWWLIAPIFGEDYLGARPLILPLTVASVFLVLYRQAAGIALVRGSEKRLGVIEALLGGSAVIVYAVATSTFGAVGAAWGSAVVYLAGFFALFWVAVSNKQLPSAAPEE